MKLLRTTAIALALATPVAFVHEADAQTNAPVAGEGEYIVYFAFDDASLSADARNVVSEVASEYRNQDVEIVIVQGHADTAGPADYNQELSARRAENVASALTQQGVSRGSIEVAAYGEDNLLVPTGDNQPEQANRRVTVQLVAAEPEVVQAPAPAPVAPAPAPEPMMQPEEEGESRFGVSVGLLYGFHTADGQDNDKVSHIGGLNLSASAGLGFARGRIEQAGFYNFQSEDDGFGGRTLVGLDIAPGFTDIVPAIGANFGGHYGPGIEDGLFAGPQVSLALPFFVIKVAYDIPLDDSLDEGIIFATVGTGIRF